MLINYLKVNKEKIATAYVVSLIGWIMGFLLMFMIKSLDKSCTEMTTIGIILALIGLAIFKMFPYTWVLNSYQLSIFMGQSRKSFIISHLFVEVILNSVFAVVIFGLYKLELFIYKCIDSKNVPEINMDFMFSPWIVISAILIISAAGIFMAGLLAWNYWLPCIIWLAICFMPSIITNENIKNTVLEKLFKSIAGFFENTQEPIILLIVGSAAVIMMLLGSVLVYRKELSDLPLNGSRRFN